jgi:hypothetical protein
MYDTLYEVDVIVEKSAEYCEYSLLFLSQKDNNMAGSYYRLEEDELSRNPNGLEEEHNGIQSI